MKDMRYAITILFVVLGFGTVSAEEADHEGSREVASVAIPVADTIIDTELMNKGVWAEPYFRGPNETSRETASSEAGVVDNEKSSDQYLDVLETITTSQSSVSRSWMEYKALSED